MSAALLDVNVLIALLDPGHVNFEAAHLWKGSHRDRSWATCPIIINGCVRILTKPAYPGIRVTPAEMAEVLRELCAGSGHEFWPDDISLLDNERFDLQQIQGPQQLTDVYLLGLAVKRGGQLVTFDRSIPWRAVRGAKASHLKFLVS